MKFRAVINSRNRYSGQKKYEEFVLVIKVSARVTLVAVAICIIVQIALYRCQLSSVYIVLLNRQCHTVVVNWRWLTLRSLIVWTNEDGDCKGPSFVKTMKRAKNGLPKISIKRHRVKGAKTLWYKQNKLFTKYAWKAQGTETYFIPYKSNKVSERLITRNF